MATSNNGMKGAAERTGDNSRRSEILPPAVEAVVCMGYPSDLVISTFQQLLSAREPESHTTNHPPRNGAMALTRNAPSQSVSAASLLAAVDDALRHSSFRSSEGTGLAAPLESSFSLDALQGHEYGEGMLSESETVQVDGLEDNAPSTPQQCSPHCEQQQFLGQAAANSTQPSTDSQTSCQSSISGQLSNAERAVQPMETTSTSTAAGTDGLETASSLIMSGSVSSPAESPEGAPDSTTSTSLTRNAAIEFTSANASSGSGAAISAVATTDQHEATPPSTACAESEAASRDRSPAGRGEGTAAPTEEEAREKRRQLLTRLQALREENRRLKARQTCLHCRQNPVALTLLPCGHFCLCQECGASFDTCPLCRKAVLADVRTFVT